MAGVITEHDRVLGRDADRQKMKLGRNPPSWVADEAIWEEAKKEARKSGPHDEFHAVVTHIYKKMGGRIK